MLIECKNNKALVDCMHSYNSSRKTAYEGTKRKTRDTFYEIYAYFCNPIGFTYSPRCNIKRPDR